VGQQFKDITAHLSEHKALEDAQEAREEALRAWACGRREASSADIKERAAGRASLRYSRAAIGPCSDDLRRLSQVLLAGDYVEASRMLDSPLIGRLSVSPRALDTGTPLWSILTWLADEDRQNFTKGGRYWDPALDFMATTLSGLFGHVIRHDGSPTLNSVLGFLSGELRDLTIRQWVSRFQGVSTVKTINRRMKDKEGWQKTGQLQGISALLSTQAEGQLRGVDMETLLQQAGSRTVISVVDPRTKKDRRIEFSKGSIPTEADWLLLETTITGTGTTRRFSGPDRSSAWATVALLCVAIMQLHTGAMKVVQRRVRGSDGRRQQRYLELGEEVTRDLDKIVYDWTQSAYVFDPMWCAPALEDGFGYRTVKLNPMSAKWSFEPRLDEGGDFATTKPEGTVQFEEEVGRGMAGTAFSSPWASGRLSIVRDIAQHKEALSEAPEAAHRASEHMTLDVATRCGSEHAIYMPIFMDFRGRSYYRPSWLNPQAGDLAKSLLQFSKGDQDRHDAAMQDPLTAACMLSHVRGIVGGPTEKAPILHLKQPQLTIKEARALLAAGQRGDLPGEDPYQMATLDIDSPHQMFQMDGTCNGLQHLSALAADERGGRAVNLVPVDPTKSGPQDIYLEVANAVADKLETLDKPWARRLLHGGAKVRDRKVTKRAVMVIPYGGTLGAIREYVRLAIAEDQAHKLDPSVWLAAMDWQDGQWVDDKQAHEGGYLAFAERDLKDHPLLRKDLEHLGDLVYAAIMEDVMPSAGLIMRALRAFAKAAGDRLIQWRVRNDEDSLWVTQGRTKMRLQRTRTVGLHLPAMTKTVALFGVREEGGYNPDQIDTSYHVNSIVPNFVHSHDADHMASVAGEMHRLGHPFASVHDCFLTNGAGLGDLYRATRETFARKYTGKNHPLEQPVRWLRAENTGAGKEAREWASWREALAEVCPEIELPKGTLDIQGVVDSFWFFC
jgi:hypothetical protein